MTTKITEKNISNLANAGVQWQSVIVADGSTTTTGVAGRGYFINTTSAAHTFTLPATATFADTILIKDYAGTFATNKLTIARNGHNIQGVANNSLIGTNRASVTLVYVDVTRGWEFVTESNVADLGQPLFISATGGTITTSGNFKIHSFTNDGSFVVSQIGNSPLTPLGGPSNVDYLVVAGGGGGNVTAGGGAGGFREGRVLPAPESYTASPLVAPAGLPVSVTTYPITVGAGGAAGVISPSGPSPLPGIPASSNGSDSIFSTITSSGGGKAGRYGGGAGANAAGSGGSGGGGYENQSVGSGNTPPVIPSQGNPGGNNPGGNGSGGGGGATSSGPSTPSVENGNPGGNGATTSISGSPVAYAGGGAGGELSTVGGTAGTGGTGGGGNAVLNGVGNSGTNNTGGGGAGGAYASCNAGWMGGSGGKGIVIIRYKFQ